MPATQKLTAQARLALAQGVELLEQFPTDSPEAIQTRVSEALNVCEWFIATYIDFNPGLFLDACEIGQVVSLADGDEAKRIGDED